MARMSPFNWIIETLESNKKVESTTIISDTLLNISRTDGPPLSVTKTSLDSFTVADINKILDIQDAEFILHTLKEPYINGSVFDFLDSKQKILGGFGDLIRVVNKGNNWPYLPPDVHFIIRGLKQHTKVSNVRRLDNKRYEISRQGLESVIIIALNDYDLGIESIRAAVDEYDTFDAVFKSNPNGSITSSAVELTNSREIKVLKWGELLSKLNIKWK